MTRIRTVAMFLAAMPALHAIPAIAQPRPSRSHVEIGVGLLWAGSIPLGAKAATETTASGGTSALFSTTSELAGVAGLEGRIGVRVTQSSNGYLLIAAFVSRDKSMTKFDIANYIVSHVQDPLTRIDGVGNFNVFGTQYAMRVWLDTDKLNSFQLTPIDVTTAITNQNVQVAGGQLGGTPAPSDQHLTATITEATLLRTPA